jgi:F0F1-type ATP synthase assembly protein I
LPGPKDAGDPRRDPDPNWGRYVGVGLQMLVGVGLGLLVGRWLDRKFGWEPWGVFAGTMLGLAAGMYLLIKDAIRMNKD